MSETILSNTRATAPQLGRLNDEATMDPRPKTAMANYRASDKLTGKVALITGGASGIGRAVAISFAKEGADVAIAWFDETEDAAETVRLIEAEGRRAVSASGDIGNADFCRELVRRVVAEFDRIDILVNNAAEQHLCPVFEDIQDEQIERTFRTNILSQLFLTRSALPYMPDGSAIINTTSVTAYTGSPAMVDDAATKGAIVAFTRSAATSLLDRNIRVNGVALGPIRTPLIAAGYPPDNAAYRGESAPMGRAGEPEEVAPCYVFLASAHANYMTGQVLHPNGGTIVNG